jgi:hypothetical protein
MNTEQSPPCGAEAPTFRSGEEAPPSWLSMEGIVVAVKTLHHSTIPGVDPINRPYPKRAGGAYGNPPQVNPSCFQVPRDHCSYQIARRAAAYPLLSREVASGKARCIHIGALIPPASLCDDDQGTQRGQTNTCQLANAQRIEAVRFLYSKAVSIPAGASTAPASHRQAQSRERLDERVSGRVDRCGVP